MRSLARLLVIPLKALAILSLVVCDNFHFYSRDVMQHMYWAALAVWNFIFAVFRFYHTICHHLLYLETNCLQDYHGLMDITGSYTTDKYIAPEGNAVGGKPAERIIGFTKNETKNPAHFPISSLAMHQAWFVLDQHINYHDAVYVDFGCGVGTSLLSAMTRPFQQIIGVEMNKSTAALCQLNVDKFLKESKDSVQCANICIKDMDMVKFNLEEEKNCESRITVLMIYEPLWTISKSHALCIYSKVLRNIGYRSAQLYVVYFFAGKYTGDALPALRAMNHKLVYEGPYPSLFFGANDTLYIFKIMM